MSEAFIPCDGDDRKKTAIELTRFLVHKHYCENDFLADESLFDEPFLWFGAAEHEFASGRETVLDIFRQFTGKVPRCNIADEEYTSEMIAPDVCLVAGRMWISTDPSTEVYLRVHQRITTCIRWTGDKARCCMLHVSNPYTEMEQDDVGFPTRMAQQSRDYMAQQIEEQKQKISSQASELSDIYNTVSCGILRLIRKEDGYHLLTFNHALAELMDRTEDEVWAMDWSMGFGDDVDEVDIPRLRSSIDRLAGPGDRSSIDYRIVTYRGRTVYLTSINDYISSTPEGEIIQRLTYDISDRVALETALQSLSFYDTLTGVFNRNRFNEIITEYSDRELLGLGVAVLDINGLKKVNDGLGHVAGDDLLMRTGRHINEIFPGKAFRTGGDEFVIVDEEGDRDSFEAQVASLRVLLARDGISVAIGTCWRDSECSVWDQAEEADKVMYREKQEYYIQSGGGEQSLTFAEHEAR